MRRADRWVGTPVCFVLTLARRMGEGLRQLFRHGSGRQAASGTPTRERSPRSIVFVKLAEQGSTVLAYPALRRAVEMVGRDHVYFLVFDANRFILDAMEVIPHRNVIAIRSNNLLTTMLSALGAVWRMRRRRIEAAVDLEFFARSSAVMAYLSGARVRVGFHPWFGEASYRGDLMTHRLNYNPELHAAQSFRMMVEALLSPPEKVPALDIDPIELTNVLPRLTPTREQAQLVEALLCRETGQRHAPPMVLLNANCSDLMPLRRWPTPRYVELARRITAAFPGVWIGFTGAPEDAPAVNDLLRTAHLERTISLAGKTTLRELLVLYSLCRVLVTNDSGPAHFASLTPIHVVTLFGPETPRLFGAPSPRNHLLYAGIACSPCVNAFNDRQSACQDNLCMQRITVDDVFEQVRAILQQEPVHEART